MKKRILILALALVCLLMLASCGCKHEWIDPNCTDPATCALCGKTEGAPTGHSWLAATCSAPKTCEDCGATQGEALSHSWTEATCETPATCAVCGAIQGEPLGHSWLDATYEAPKTCETCGKTEGEPLEATASDFTSSAAYTTFCQLFDEYMGTMSPQYEYNAESCVLFVSLTAREGTAYDLTTNPDGIQDYWETLKGTLADLTSSAQTVFSNNGYSEVSCCIMLLNDANPDNVLLGIMNGQVIFDATEG